MPGLLAEDRDANGSPPRSENAIEMVRYGLLAYAELFADSLISIAQRDRRDGFSFALVNRNFLSRASDLGHGRL